MAQRQFQTEVSRLLHLIIHSLYSNREVFLRELISNASDALDKLKYLSVADDAYKGISFDPRIDIAFNREARTLSVSDNGIGMNEADLADALGTIARSGTAAFLRKLEADAKKDSNLIGQFGVGFYSAFMAAERIEVTSRKAGEDAAWKWSSDGKETYDIEPAVRDSRGTTVLLHLTDEGLEYANRWAIEDIIKRYSNHVAFPIYLAYEEKEWDDKGNEKGGATKTERVNSGAAIWRRPKTELSDADYNEFYKQLSRDDADPLLRIHTRAEGALEYTTLLYVPSKAPFDMFHADYKPGVKLYVRRVFITDDDKDLMPTWLRFVRGVIDSEDLPLNVSREILQRNKVLANIKSASVKKVLSELKALSEGADRAKWDAFVGEFNRPLKEGVYADFANREAILELVRFKSSAVEGWTSLADYVSRMKADQKYIYYITGGDERTLKASPLLEAYRAKGVEVLVMDEEVDELVAPQIGRYKRTAGDAAKEWELRAVNRTGADEELGDAPDAASEDSAKPVIDKIRNALGERVKDVKLSRRLQDSPSCIVADEGGLSPQLTQMMKAMGQPVPDVKPILEVNAAHPLVSSLKDTEDALVIADTATVLLDQALLVEGGKLDDPADFVKRLNRLLGRQSRQ